MPVRGGVALHRPTAEEVARHLHLALGARLAGGEFGAFRVADAGGRSGVLKLLPPSPGLSLARVRRAVDLADRLRPARYPIPEYWDVGEVDGVVYSVQARCAGEVPDRLTLPQAQRMLDLWRLHADAASAPGQWASYAVLALRHGAPGGLIDHAAVRAAGPRPAALIDEAAAVGERIDASRFRALDIVHGDFHHRNLLVDADGGVTAIFDWEGAHPGDSRLDLATLNFWTVATGQPCAAWVTEQARALIEPVVRGVLAALIAGGLLTFAVDARPGYMEWALEAAEQVLAPQWRSPQART
jgi:aminoglycoside phosphotransferase (APT) family kinase protein